jgi:uncharacterized membrane protein YfcA
MHLSLVAYGLLALAGFSAGLVDAIAGGGGIISLPALLAVGLPPHLALGTNKLQAGLGTSMAAANYARRGLLVRAEVPLAASCTAAGALAGAALVTQLPSLWLARVVPWLLLAIFVHVVRAPRFGEAERVARIEARPFSIASGLLLGSYDGFFGPGTGSFWTIAFVALRGFSLQRATAQTKAMNLTSNAVALAWFAVRGDVAWRLGLAVAAANVAGALVGSSLAIERGARLIRAFFLLAVGATVMRLVWRTLVR